MQYKGRNKINISTRVEIKSDLNMYWDFSSTSSLKKQNQLQLHKVI